jgi:branched-chain amino acid transport system ATP-binding protein
MSALLSVRGLSIRFGGIDALRDVSFDVEAGRITGLIGPNGAGKTTCFNCITRLYEPWAGNIMLREDDLLRVAPQRIVGKRIARTFQNVALFGRMTVLENVLVGGHARTAGLGRTTEAAMHAEAHDILARLGLRETARRSVGTLPFGMRKHVELARALMARPQLLLLDEPAAGLDHAEVDRLGATIKRVAQDFSATILMVEHHMRLVMGVCDHIVVLAAGRKLAEGSPQSVRRDRAVIEAYLGSM